MSVAGWTPVEAPPPAAPPAAQGWTPVNQAQSSPEQPGRLRKMWNWLNEGIISKDTMVRAISGMTSEQLDKELGPSENESPTHAALREFTRGAIQDTGQTASSFTSPLAVGTIGAGAASKIPGAAGATAQAVTKLASAGFAGQGVKDVVEADWDNTADAWQKRLAGTAQALIGARGAATETPELSSALVPMKDVLQKAPGAVSRMVKGPEADPTADFVKAVPPSKSTPYTPEQFDKARPYLEAEHQNAPITSVEGLRDAADSAIGKIEDHVKGYIQANPQDQITTKPLDDVKARLDSIAGQRKTFAQRGLMGLSEYPLDQPMTVADADVMRRQMNAENKAILKKNNYDVATARTTDPEFTAREAAAESLREGIYQKLEDRGIQGVKELRQDEGALIAVRNGAQNQIFNGDKKVVSTGEVGGLRKTAAALVRAGATGGGAMIAGPTGAIVGAGAGEAASRAMMPEALTRDALVERSFSTSIAQSPQMPTVPPAPPIRGLLPPGPTPLPASNYTLNPQGQPVPNPPPLQMSLTPASPRVKYNAKTGKMEKVFTGESRLTPP